MASPSTSLQQCSLSVNLFSGAREPLAQGTQVLLTLRDGNQNAVALPNNGIFDASSIAVNGLPFFNNFGDSYSVVASAGGYGQAGFTPVTVSPQAPAPVDLMLLKRDPSFNFGPASWERLRQTHPEFASLLAAGADDDSAAQDRYTQLMETQPAVLACFFNLATAMSQIYLPAGTPLDYIHQIIWDDSQQQGPQQDRFFAWADPKLIDQILQAGPTRFAPEVDAGLFHPGATRSWKQIQFGEANVQLTFHEGQKQNIGGIECVVIEPDIDYYKDLLAHAILEVAYNAISHTLTDPRQVYVLRWMAGRQAGIPNFDPPYFLE